MPAYWNEHKQEWRSEPYTADEVQAHSQEILALKAKGMTVKQVAQTLGIAVPTVYARLKRAKDLQVDTKLRVRRQALMSEGLKGAALEAEMVNLIS